MTHSLIIMKAALAISQDVDVFELRKSWMSDAWRKTNDFADFESTFWAWEEDPDVYGPNVELKLHIEKDGMTTVLVVTFTA